MLNQRTHTSLFLLAGFLSIFCFLALGSSSSSPGPLSPSPSAAESNLDDQHHHVGRESFQQPDCDNTMASNMIIAQ